MTAAPVSLPVHAPDGARATASDAEVTHLQRLRWAVRAVLTLGVTASIAANVLHARPNLISQLIAAWPPLALLLTVELISRVPAHRGSLAVLRLLAAAVIAGIAAWVSYWHMTGVAARYGETNAAASYLLPISVDGLVVVASISLVEIAGRIRTATPGTSPTATLIGATLPPTNDPEPPPISAPPTAPAKQTNTSPIRGIGRDVAALPLLDQTATGQLGTPVRHEPHRDGTPSIVTDRDDGRSRLVGGSDGSGQNARYGGRLPHPDPAVIGKRSKPPDDKPVLEPRAPRQETDASGVQPQGVGTATGDADEAVPTETAAAVGYWHRRNPSLRPADIAAKIGRSERTVRRYWPPAPARGVNGHDPNRLTDGLRST